MSTAYRGRQAPKALIFENKKDSVNQCESVSILSFFSELSLPALRSFSEAGCPLSAFGG